MSFSELSGKSASTAVYKAVVLGTEDSDFNSNDLKECLLPPASSSGSSSSSPKSKCPAFLLLMAGSCFGVVAALFGLFWLVSASPSAIFGNHEKSNLGIFFFALAWSSATAITAYAVFSIILYCFGDDINDEGVDESQQESEPHAEYNFALGVFAGFCATCTVHDATHGVPLTSLLLTAGVAAFWGLLMTVTVRKSFAATKERKGTKLPMPAFMV